MRSHSERKITERVKLLIGGVVSTFLVACSGKTRLSPATNATGGADSGGGPPAAQAGASMAGAIPALDDFPHAYAEGMCQLLVRCYAPLGTEVSPDCATSFELLFREQRFPLILTAIAEGRVEYHGAALTQCLDTLSTERCDLVPLPDCSRVFVGTKKKGEACTLDLECVDQQCVVDGACPGVCAPLGGVDAPCTTENLCQPELTCEADLAGVGRCVKTLEAGQVCRASEHCGGYTFCSNRFLELPDGVGTCIAHSGIYEGRIGDFCEPTSEPLCEPNLVCTPRVEAGTMVGRCQPRVASGSACTYSTPDACSAGEYCRISSDAGIEPATGTCTPKPGVGEECRYGNLQIAPCGTTEFCNLETKLCAESKHLDEACSIDEECFSTRCSAGKCVPPLECEKSGEP